jgi:hypothetical protein
MARFIALHCTDETSVLIASHPSAFLLLTQIAMRAKWKNCGISGMKAGEAFIGDWQEAGLRSRQAYRHAKDVLERNHLATFRGTNKGTIATLSNSMIYSITTPAEEPSNNQQRNQPTTTNHTDTQNTQNTKREKKEKAPLPPECFLFADWFYSLLSESKRPTGNWKDGFAATYDELTRIDKLSKDEIKAVCEFGLKDEFWKKNFAIPSYLRKRSKTTGLKHFEQIKDSMLAEKRAMEPKKSNIYTVKL